MINALTIDVEDWYHDASRPNGPATAAEIRPVGSRVRRNVEALFEILARHKTRATLFFLAAVASEQKDLVRRAIAEGHEIACHGLDHRPVGKRSRKEFQDDVRTSRAMIEDIAGIEVTGFRAPYFLQPDDLWALDVLAEAGFRYDSSYMPLRYFPSDVPMLSEGRGPVQLESGLWEFPLPISRLPTGHMLPAAAGGFSLRALPFSWMSGHLRRFNDEVGATVVYTHPWEIDPDSPKLPGTPGYVRWFNRVGRSSMVRKLDRLLSDFEFAPIEQVFARELSSADSPRN